MNRHADIPGDPNSDLVTVHRYVTGELSGTETEEFERQLVLHPGLCDLVADMVLIQETVRAVTAESRSSAPAPQILRRERMTSVIALVGVVLLAVSVGLKSFHTSAKSTQSLPDVARTAQTLQDVNAAALWAAMWSMDEREVLPDVDDSEEERSPDAVMIPDWMFVAVEADEKTKDDMRDMLIPLDDEEML